MPAKQSSIYLKNGLYTIPFFLFTFNFLMVSSCFGQASSDSLFQIKNQTSYEKLLDSLIRQREEIGRINSRLSHSIENTERLFTHIDLQLTWSGIVLAVIGVVVATITFWQGNRMQKIWDAVDASERSSREIVMNANKTADEIRDIDSAIQNNLQGLFVKLRKFETDDRISRLRVSNEEIFDSIAFFLSNGLTESQLNDLIDVCIANNRVHSEATISSYCIVFQKFGIPQILASPIGEIFAQNVERVYAHLRFSQLFSIVNKIIAARHSMPSKVFRKCIESYMLGAFDDFHFRSSDAVMLTYKLSDVGLLVHVVNSMDAVHPEMIWLVKRLNFFMEEGSGYIPEEDRKAIRKKLDEIIENVPPF